MRVSHLAAMATLVALLGAMFIAMGSVSAAPSVTIEFKDSDGVVADGTDQQVRIRVSDSAATESTTATLVWIRVSGELDGPALSETLADNQETLDADTIAVITGGDVGGDDGPAFSNYMIAVPKGTTPGEYTVSAHVTIGEDAFTPSKVLTVGDAGDAVASAEISLSTVGDATEDADDPDDTGDGTEEDYADDGESPPHTKGNNSDSNLAPAGTPIFLKLTVLNSRGKVTDDDAISAVDIIAPGGVLSKHDANSDGTAYTTAENTPYPLPDTIKNSLDYADGAAKAVTYFAVQRDKAGSLDVEAVVVGSGGIAKADVFTVSFTGGAASISLGAPSSPLGTSGTAYLDVTATDASDNPAGLAASQVSASVPSDEGSNKFNVVKTQWLPKAGLGFDSTADADQPDVTSTADMDESHDDDVCNGTEADSEDCDESMTTVRLIITTTKASAGEHELEVKLGDSDAQTATLVVAGAADEISVEADTETVAVTDIIEVTVSVTDAGGNPVVNDPGSVEFNTAGSLVLEQLGSDGARDLKNGQSSARFVVVSGSGAAIIIATYDDKLSGTISVGTAPVEAEAMPEEEASVSCLSELSGFATWSCGVSADASEIFEMVSARGVSAIHLWNGSTWVRYSVVDDAMVPGSSDFMVTENDILYISN